MPSLYKILIVCHSSRSMEPAYDVISCLQELGYATDLCHINDDDNPSKIQAIQVLDEELGLSSYEGVAFLDDGGDVDVAIEIAKKATEKELVVGGYGSGALVLAEAGLFQDNYICQGFDEKYYEKATLVESPSVRDDKLVTATEGCATGFAILLTDALGGEVKHIVRAESKNIPSETALIIASISHWSDFWPLAKEMNTMGSALILSDWNNIDVDAGKISCCAYLDIEANDVRLLSDQPIPRSIWFRDPSLTPVGTINAIAQLENHGCVNINSSDSVRKLMDKNLPYLLADISGKKCNIFNSDSLGSAAEKLSKPGVYAVNSVPGVIRKTSMRVRGQGHQVIVSKNKNSKKVHKILSLTKLKATLTSTFNQGDFVIRDASNNLRVGDSRFELLWIMRRSSQGWGVSKRLARSDKMTCYANEVIRLVFPDEWESVLQDADAVSEIVSVVLQSLMGQSDELSEMGMVIMMDGDEPFVSEVEPIVDPSMEHDAKLGRGELLKTAQALCVPFEGTIPKIEEGTELAKTLSVRSRDPLHRRVVERELAHEGIWLQPNGTIAILACDTIEKADGLKDLAERLHQEAIDDAKAEVDAMYQGGSLELRMAAESSKRSRHRLRLSMEMLYLTKGDIKLAGLYPSDVAGPYSNLDINMQSRVITLREGDDWLADREKSISDQTRYNPEYEKTSPGSSAGFFFTWDEPNRTPTDWLNVLQGDTIYKTRNLLNPGKMY